MTGRGVTLNEEARGDGTWHDDGDDQRGDDGGHDEKTTVIEMRSDQETPVG